MIIKGYLQTSVIEWPGKISSVIFTSGCNFRCGFCYNRGLVDTGYKDTKIPEYKEKDILEDLEKRKKWVDAVALSISGDEPVIIRKNNLIYQPKILSLWDDKKPAVKNIIKDTLIEKQSLKKIDCLTTSGFIPATEIIRHKTNQLYEITCGPGNYKIKTTQSHSVLTIFGSKLIAKRVDSLKQGDWLLSPRKVSPEKEIDTIFLLDYVPILEINKNTIENRKKYWTKIVSQIGKKTISALSREYSHQRKTIREYFQSFKNNFADLLDEWIIEENFLRYKTSRVKIPTTIKLDEDFGEFLGYAVAEGCVRFSQTKRPSGYLFTLGDEPEFAERILFLFRKIFLQKSGAIIQKKAKTGNYQYLVTIGEEIIGRFISELVGSGYINKKIPEIIYNSTITVQQAFIKGLIRGDGHTRERINKSQQEVSIKTGSPKLAEDLVLLAKILDCFAWVEQDGKYFRIVFSVNDLFRLGISKNIDTKYSFETKIHGIPKELIGVSLRGQKRINTKKLQWIFDQTNLKRKAVGVKVGYFNSKGETTPKYKKLLFLYELASKWDFKEIKSITKIKLNKSEYVYDLVVPKNHTFVGGRGGILLHNTGGEPTLQPDLPEFLKKIKDMGFKTMIETNGSNPEIIARLLALSEVEGLHDSIVDRFAMDLKGPFGSYSQITNSSIPISNIQQSINLIINSGIEYEFRTTVVPGIHDKKVLAKMVNQLKAVLSIEYSVFSSNWKLQNFQPKNCLDPKFNKVKPFTEGEFEELQKIVK